MLYIMGIGEITKCALLLLTKTTSHLSWNLKFLYHQQQYLHGQPNMFIKKILLTG